MEPGNTSTGWAKRGWLSEPGVTQNGASGPDDRAVRQRSEAGHFPSLHGVGNDDDGYVYISDSDDESDSEELPGRTKSKYRWCRGLNEIIYSKWFAEGRPPGIVVCEDFVPPVLAGEVLLFKLTPDLGLDGANWRDVRSSITTGCKQFGTLHPMEEKRALPDALLKVQRVLDAAARVASGTADLSASHIIGRLQGHDREMALHADSPARGYSVNVVWRHATDGTGCAVQCNGTCIDQRTERWQQQAISSSPSLKDLQPVLVEWERTDKTIRYSMLGRFGGEARMAMDGYNERGQSNAATGLGSQVAGKSKSRVPDPTSKYTGVSFRPSKNKRLANIRINKKSIHLGYFSSEEEAARAFDARKTQEHNAGTCKIACLNFGDEWDLVAGKYVRKA